MSLTELFTSQFTPVALLIIFSSLYLLHVHLTLEKRVSPEGIPWSGLRKEWFAIPRAHVREIWYSRKFIADGYQKYAKAGKAFLTPNRNWQPEVVLAPSQVKWLVDLPESDVSIKKVLMEDVAFHYTSPRSWNFSRPFHLESLNKMNLALMTDDMVDEIDIRTKQYLGDSPKTKEVELNSFVWDIIAHITNRAFAGKELANNETYLMWNRRFICSLLPTSILINAVVPSILQPILGPILAIPCRFFDSQCSKYLQAEIQRYIDIAKHKKECHHEQRNPNILQLMARFAVKSDDPRDWDTHNLASRLLALNFVGIHTSSSAAINAFADILFVGEDLIERLRSEARTALSSSGGRWTKASVARLELLDSTLRESLRYSAFKARGVERQVMAKNGVYLPDGTHLPYGTKIGVPTSDIQRDADYYDNPDEFIADRFVGKAEYGMINTSDTFLAFGHGRHACPGRFFSAHELKLLFAHVVLNYDIEALKERPEHIWVSDFFVPERITISCRRRSQ